MRGLLWSEPTFSVFIAAVDSRRRADSCLFELGMMIEMYVRMCIAARELV